MPPIPRLLEVDPPSRRLLLEALLLLPVVGFGVRLLGFGRIRRRLARGVGCKGPPPDDTQTLLADRVAWAVSAAARYGPYRANCLRRGMLLWWMLARRGIDADLRFGARLRGKDVEAHAWVEHRGRVLGDSADVALCYPALLPAIAAEKEPGFSRVTGKA
jgi:hypothetical protein